MHRLLHHLIASPAASALLLVTIVLTIVALRRRPLLESLWLHPYSFFRKRRYYTLVSSGLVHADAQHLMMNCAALLLYAFALERDFSYTQVVSMDTEGKPALQLLAELIGHGKFLLLYFGSMALADATTLWRYRDDPSYCSVGASGAICGVIMASFVMGPRLSLTLPVLGGLPAWVLGLVFIGLSYLAARRRDSRVAHASHAWGALAGFVLAGLFFPERMGFFLQGLFS
jgi:membrane associated rhomboid family serine protease